MNRFDIPKSVTAIIEKAVEIDLIDASDILALGDTFGEDWDGLVNEIVSYAYSNIHVNDDHAIIVPFADSHYTLKRKVDPVVVKEELSFDDRFKIFFDGCIQKHNEYMSISFPGNRKEAFSWKCGKRYIKVIRESSVHCFVDTTNGNVLKAASWSTPAKHARGNIFNDDFGIKCMNAFGAAYLK